jgi:hypothetical protein
MSALDEMLDVKNKLANDHHDFDILLSIASMFERLADANSINELIARFHNYAGQYPYINARDVGALILEITALQTTKDDLKGRLLNEAIYRAGWCAQEATSSGEGLCRAEHLKRLQSIMGNLKS